MLKSLLTQIYKQEWVFLLCCGLKAMVKLMIMLRFCQRRKVLYRLILYKLIRAGHKLGRCSDSFQITLIMVLLILILINGTFL